MRGVVSQQLVCLPSCLLLLLLLLEARLPLKQADGLVVTAAWSWSHSETCSQRCCGPAHLQTSPCSCRAAADWLLWLAQSAAGMSSDQVAYLAAVLREKDERKAMLQAEREQLTRTLQVRATQTVPNDRRCEQQTSKLGLQRPCCSNGLFRS